MNKKMIMRVIWSDGEVTKSLRCFELRLLRRVDGRTDRGSIRGPRGPKKFHTILDNFCK